MIFLFIIILVLSVFSGYYLNKLSSKTSAILKENYLSVVYARDMTGGITAINHEITSAYLNGRNSDSLLINREITSIRQSLQKEMNNITEPGEDRLVTEIDKNFNSYFETLKGMTGNRGASRDLLSLQSESDDLYHNLLMLSDMNGRAIEGKTDDAKTSAKSALTQMTILASLCFLIGMSFTFSFASYFNQRFYQLYNGIKQIVSSNFDQHLFFEGKDEFYEISLVFNEMAEKLKKNEKKISVTLGEKEGDRIDPRETEELRQMLFRLKVLEEQAAALIEKLDKKQ